VATFLDCLVDNLVLGQLGDCCNDCARPIDRVMQDETILDAETSQNSTLWFETLPTGDTARLFIRSDLPEIHAVLYWNDQLHSERRFATQEAAEKWGNRFLDVLKQDAVAGLLLGYDRDALVRLQDHCSVA